MAKVILTCDEVRSIFDYDAVAGGLRYRDGHGRVKKGSLAGSITSHGYIKIVILGGDHLAHRLIWLHVYGTYPKTSLDHINHVRNDNRIENLREADASENMQNRRLNGPYWSGHVGVIWSKKSRKWVARIAVRMKQIQVGTFDDINDAIAARKEAVKKYHPFAPKESP
jgi:hypothetical protein